MTIGTSLRPVNVFGRAVNAVRDQVVATTSGLFSHGPQPLTTTLDHRGDPGLCGPDSISWEVIGDVTAFVGGIRALLIQAAHPEVVAGVEDHSRYQSDPLGRLTRTSLYVTETTYGAMPEVADAVDLVRRAHRPVEGTSERGRTYSADTPELAAWVHNALTDSFLTAFQAYGPRVLSTEEADRFVVEQTRIGRLLEADPMPTTAAELASWIADHPALGPTQGQANAIDFLTSPPLSLPVKLGYRALLSAAVETIPPRIRSIIGVEADGDVIGHRAVRALRWALGSSPAWHISLIRTGSPIPPGRFRQPIDHGAH